MPRLAVSIKDSVASPKAAPATATQRKTPHPSPLPAEPGRGDWKFEHTRYL